MDRDRSAIRVIPIRGKRNSVNASSQESSNGDPVRAQVGDHLADVGGSRPRAAGSPRAAASPSASAARCTASPRTSRRGCARAAPGRGPAAACGGISKPRSSSRPSRPRLLSGLYSLSMQNSARWVLPVRSVSRCRRARSTSHGRGLSAGSRGVSVSRRDLGERDLHLVDRLGPALVEPRCLAGRADEPPGEQVRQRRVPLPVGDAGSRSRSGRRSSGESIGCDPPRVMWLPPPVPVCSAVEVELLGREPRSAAPRRRASGEVAQLGPRRTSAAR